MATYEEHEASMTIIYSKSSGNVIAAFSGIQSIETLYGENAADFMLIWNEVVLPADAYVLRNYGKFKINLENSQLEIKAEAVPQYPIASQ
jgi:hypothetical protein